MMNLSQAILDWICRRASITDVEIAFGCNYIMKTAHFNKLFVRPRHPGLQFIACDPI